MLKAKKKFTLYAILAVFVMLTILLGVINIVNFAMAAEDADRITEMISAGQGQFGNMQNPFFGEFSPAGENGQPGGGEENRQPFGRFNGLGPDSPELASTVRYFSVEIEKDGGAKLIQYAISAVDEAEALEWARSLLEKQPTGWTRTVYRYRVYSDAGKTFVTVIDQGRELLPSYRILAISVIGGLAGLAVSLLVLIYVSKKVFQPLEEADRKQKRFIADVERQFKVPLTVISANTECMERENGASEYTGSIDRQVKKMTALVKELGTLAIFADDSPRVPVDLSALFRAELDAAEGTFRAKNIALSVQIVPGVELDADENAVRRMCRELAANAEKFAARVARFTLSQGNGRITLTASNDTSLPDGSAAQALDRFSRLSNAEGVPGAGLGLAEVKEIVQTLGGRVTAEVVSGTFTVRVTL